MKLDTLADSRSSVEPELRKRIQEISSDAIDLAKDVQSISRTLDPSSIDIWVSARPRRGSAERCRRNRRSRSSFSAHDLPGDLPSEVGLCVFRVLQEAVRNAVTHSGARQIRAALRCTDREIELDVADSGRGFDQSAPGGRSGLGLVIMRARVELAGGQLAIESKAGAGTTVRARDPARPAGRSGHASRDQAPRPHPYSHASAQCLASPCGSRASWA